MPKINLEVIAQTNHTDYPAPFDAPVQGRWYRDVAVAGGLTRLGASHVVLKPGAWSSQRHWHMGEDELLVVIAGAAVLVEDDGRTRLVAGDICAWGHDVENGHQLINDSDTDCVMLAISAGPDLGGVYADIDMMWDDQGRYRHKDGTAYPARP